MRTQLVRQRSSETMNLRQTMGSAFPRVCSTNANVKRQLNECNNNSYILSLRVIETAVNRMYLHLQRASDADQRQSQLCL
ncbi:hypothetical protein MESS4_330047 [Mesorhizobium sp. STM 4661]|nr:hypothetical protein MESS4_330047 [Mesorhizobium sp. STM 4661]